MKVEKESIIEEFNTLDLDRLKAFLKEKEPVSVAVGLLEDWFHTAKTAWREGKWLLHLDEEAHISSLWATPGFQAHMEDGSIIEVAASKKEKGEQGKW